MRFPLLGVVLIFTTTAALAADVTAAKEGKQVIFKTGEKEILRYQAEPGEFPREGIDEAYRRGGYIHPIRTPKGRQVTDDFPTNHVHHHGIWMPWTKTQFQDRTPDFWNMGSKTGRVEFEKLEDVWKRDGKAGLTARHRFIDLKAPSNAVALHEKWELTVSAPKDLPARYVIDLVSTQTCASEAPLKLPKYHYGGFGFRGAWAWNGPDALRILTSEGISNRAAANEQRAKWFWLGGLVDEELAGVTILCHPQNFRFPQPVRIHPKEPFFCYAPQQLGEMEITPGVPYIARYRVVVTDGEVSADLAEKWWSEYAAAKP